MRNQQHPPFPDRKISETFLDFASPLLNAMPDNAGEREFESVLKLAFTVWNAVVLADAAGEEKHLSEMRKLLSRDPVSRSLVEQMIVRKRTQFGDDHRLIGEYRLRVENGGFNLRAEARSPYPKR